MARPRVDDPKAKAKIQCAAEKLFAVRGYAATPIRDIARGAGVNPAMIHYYFGSKELLYRAILASAAAEVRGLLMKTAGDAQSTRERLMGFVKAYASYIFGHPNLARILHREFLAGGKHLKEIAHEQYVTNYTLMRESLREGIRRGDLRQLDIDLAPISLIGMILIFQIAQPLISIALGRNKYDEQFINRLSAHTVDLFLNGAQNNHKAPSKKAPGSSQKKQQRARRQP